MFSSWGKKPAAASPNSAAPPPPAAAAPQPERTMFNGLFVKPAPGSENNTNGSTTQTSTSGSVGSAFGFISGASVSQATSPSPAVPSVSTTTEAPSAMSSSAPVSAFSFLASPAIASSAPITTPAASPAAPPAPSAFSFLSSSSPSVPPPAPSPSTRPAVDKALLNAAIDQSKAIEQRVNEEYQKRSLSTRMSAEASQSPQAGIPFAGLMASQPVRKKKISSKRPGYARSGEVDDDAVAPGSAVSSSQPQSMVLDSSSSILAGLTVYVEDTSSTITAEDASHVSEEDHRELQSVAPVQSPRESQQRTARRLQEVSHSAHAATEERIVSDAATIDRSMEAAGPSTFTEAPAPTLKEVSKSREVSVAASPFLNAAQTFALALSELDTAFNENAEKEVKMYERKKKLNETVNALVDDQNRAMEEENFERAETLQVEIDQIRRELSEVDELVVVLMKDRTELDMKREELFTSQLAEIERQVDEAEVESRRTASKASASTQQYQTERSIARRKLEEKENALQSRLETAQSEMAMTQDECEKLKERIATGTVELRTDRETWEAKVLAVDEEIALLEKQLEEKRAERVTLAKHVIDADEKITQVTSKYASRLQEVEVRASQYQTQLDKAAKEQDDLNQAKTELELRVQGQDKELASLAKQSTSAKNKYILLDRLLARLRQEGAARRKRMTEFQKESKHIQSLQDEFVWKRSRAELLEKDLLMLENQALEDGRFLSESNKELPEMENQKQLWVSMRNFKEAGRVAADIKAMQAKRQEASQRLEDSKMDLDEKRANLTSLQGEIQATKTQLDALIIRSDNEKLHGYLSMAAELQATIDDILNHCPKSPSEEGVQEGVQDEGEAMDQERTKEKDAEEASEPDLIVEHSDVAPILIMLRAELGSVNDRIRLMKAKLGDKVDLSASSQDAHSVDANPPVPLPDVATGGVTADEHDESETLPDVSLEELEKQLDDAVQQEDFERADHVSSLIDRLKTAAAAVQIASSAQDMPGEEAFESQAATSEAGVDAAMSDSQNEVQMQVVHSDDTKQQANEQDASREGTPDVTVVDSMRESNGKSDDQNGMDGAAGTINHSDQEHVDIQNANGVPEQDATLETHKATSEDATDMEDKMSEEEADYPLEEH